MVARSRRVTELGLGARTTNQAWPTAEALEAIGWASALKPPPIPRPATDPFPRAPVTGVRKRQTLSLEEAGESGEDDGRT